MKKLDIELCVKAAEEHGLSSEPDHEVGDLQCFLRSMWELLTPGQQLQYFMNDDVRDIVEAELNIELDESVSEFANTIAQPAKAEVGNNFNFHTQIIANFPGYADDTEVSGGHLVDWIGAKLPTFLEAELLLTQPAPLNRTRPKP